MGPATCCACDAGGNWDKQAHRAVGHRVISTWWPDCVGCGANTAAPQGSLGGVALCRVGNDRSKGRAQEQGPKVASCWFMCRSIEDMQARDQRVTAATVWTQADRRGPLSVYGAVVHGRTACVCYLGPASLTLDLNDTGPYRYRPCWLGLDGISVV